MQVGTRLRITLHGDSEDFVITDTQGYATSVLDAQRLIRIALVNGKFTLPNTRKASVQVVQALIGNPHLNIRVLAKVDTRTLNSLAQHDAYVQTLYQSDELWFAKIEADFGEEVVKYKPRDISAHEFYAVYAEIQRREANAVSQQGRGADTVLLRLRGADAVLVSAVQTGNLNAVKIALSVGANVNTNVDIRGSTVLMEAAGNGWLEIVRELIQSGANVNTADRTGYTALMEASKKGHFEIVQALIQAGADVNAMSYDGFIGWTALIAAAMAGNVKVVKELLAHGANVNAVARDTSTALMSAAHQGHLEVVQELLRAGANVNATNRFGSTALTIAAEYDHQDVVNLLREHGAT